MKIIHRFDGLRVPAYALPYLINGDDSGISTEDKQTIDRWHKGYEDRLQEGESLIFSTMEEDSEEYFTWRPAFGLACNVVDCVILIVRNS